MLHTLSYEGLGTHLTNAIVNKTIEFLESEGRKVDRKYILEQLEGKKTPKELIPSDDIPVKPKKPRTQRAKKELEPLEDGCPAVDDGKECGKPPHKDKKPYCWKHRGKLNPNNGTGKKRTRTKAEEHPENLDVDDQVDLSTETLIRNAVAGKYKRNGKGKKTKEPETSSESDDESTSEDRYDGY